MRIVVTGAARGIGRAISRRLVADSKSRDGVPAKIVISDQHAAELVPVPGDMADPAFPAKLIDATAGFGGLDVLISNAGFSIVGPLAEYKIEDWDRIFAVHVRGAWLLAKAAFPHLKQSQGCIVMTCSISGTHATPPLGAYSPSKAASLTLMRQLAIEWGPEGIRVNALSPGLTHTSGTDLVYSNPAVKAERARQIPLRRVAEPEDMANAVSFLTGPDAKYVHGVDLVVDGGLSNCMMANLNMSNAWKPDMRSDAGAARR
jgi:glucose 1-dehydrogenase